MKISSWYKKHFERRIAGRYVTAKHIKPLLDFYHDSFEISEIGSSELSEKIHCVKLGYGNKVVLAWSQMHGNESTTTKALFDFLKFIAQKEVFQDEIDLFLANHSFYFIPILNPDGAHSYTRENSNGVDLNRDAQDLSQSESKTLRSLFDSVKPDLCLNLHDQRTMYSLPNDKSATVSFLAPAADAERTVTTSRKLAMNEIEKLFGLLTTMIPGHIGRYDDGFNANCVGDTFQQMKVPTILFEAGHYPKDYEREKTREYIFYALLRLFDIIDGPPSTADINYAQIPQNGKRFKDVIIRNVRIEGESTDLAINYNEVLAVDRINLVPVVEKIGDLDMFLGHQEIDALGVEILLNSCENVFVNEKVATIVDKYSNKVLFS